MWPSAPERSGGADIIYLPSQSDLLYLSLVTAACSRKVVAMKSGRPSRSLGAFRLALRRRRACHAPVHHADRDIPYCSVLYQRLHAQHGSICSRTDGYDCYQTPRPNGSAASSSRTAKRRPQDLVQVVE